MKIKKVKISKRITAFALAVILTFGILPHITFAVEDPADDGLHIVNPGADDVSPVPKSGELADGEVWTDKSAEYAQNGIFDITLRAMGKRFSMELAEYRERYTPVNAVFVLDTSSSMSYNSLKSKINAVVEAGAMILNANPGKNSVAVVYFDRTARLAGGSTYGYFTGGGNAATSVSGNNQWTSTKTLSTTWIWANTAEQLNELIAYDGYNQLAPVTTAATNIVSGLNLAYSLLNSDGGALPAAPNKNEANPIIILMSDGAPNYYSTAGSYTNSTAGSTSPGAAGDETSSAETIKRAAEISNLYIGTNPGNKIKIYTVGYNVESNYLAWITLNPKNDHTKLSASQTKMTVNSQLTGGNVIFTSGDKTVRITGATNGIGYYQYNTHYYAPLYTQDLLAAFKEIVGDITFDPASPLAYETELVITDVIGDGFELIPGSFSPNDSAVHYNSNTKTVTWTIPAGELYLIDPDNWGAEGENSDVVPNRINTLTFQVRATGEFETNKPEDGIYYTNNGAYADFIPHDRNDKYTNKSTNRVSIPKRGWLQYESPSLPDDTSDTTEETTETTTDTTASSDTNGTITTTTAESLYYPPHNPNTPFPTGGDNSSGTTEPTVYIEPTRESATEIVTEPGNTPVAEQIPENTVPLENAPQVELFEPEEKIPLSNGGFAVEEEDNLYEIFDKNGELLGEIQLNEDENIEDITDFNNLIPLESAGIDETEAKINPQTADPMPFSVFLYTVAIAISGIIIIKNKKFTKR
ncbi:MAG: VWA domain-containing protein [Oscillospiraceae bacterium]|nr:VWA domain-containing protein [Oscillospiraceae bacterium]